MSKRRNLIVEQMSFCVCKRDSETKVLLINSRFESVSDAILFKGALDTKFPSTEWVVIMQYYNDHNCLMMHEWGAPLNV